MEEAEGGIGRPERKRQARRLLQADLRRTAWAGLPCVHVVLPRFWQPSDLTAALREDNLAALKYGEKVPKMHTRLFAFLLDLLCLLYLRSEGSRHGTSEHPMTDSLG